MEDPRKARGSFEINVPFIGTFQFEIHVQGCEENLATFQKSGSV